MKLFITSIILCTNLNLAFAKTFNVKDFGAKGDGKTDDAKAIQAAIDAAPVAALSTIYFPKGTYILGSYIVTSNYLENYVLRLHSNLTFKGVGKSSVIKLANHIFDNTDSNANAHLFYGIKISNICFLDLQIDLNGGKNLVPENIIKNNCGIFILHGSNVTISKVVMKNASGRNMIIIIGSGKKVLIERSKFLNGGHYVGTLDHNKFQPDFSFIYCEWDSTSVTDNLIEQQNIELALNGISGGIELHGSHSLAAGNIIIGCSPGIYVTSSRHAVERITVEKNQFLNCTRGISFWINYPMENINLSNNIIQLTHFRKWKNYVSSGIEMPNGNTTTFDSRYANAAPVDKLVIANNIINAPTQQTTTDRTVGMVLHSIQNCEIVHNTITGMSFGGVVLQGSKWGSSTVNIKGNRFIDFKTNFDQLTPAAYISIFDSYILVEKTAPGLKNIYISNNFFTRTKTNVVDDELLPKKKGRFTGIYLALPEFLKKEIHINSNHFSSKNEGVEFVKTVPK